MESSVPVNAKKRRGESLPGHFSWYYLAFFLYCFWGWLSRTTLWDFDETPVIGVVENAVQVVILLLLAISFLRQRSTTREWIIAIFIGALGFIVWRTAAEGWLFWIALFVICGKGAHVKSLAAVLLLTVSLVLVFSIAASSLNLIENIVAIRTSNGAVRAAMGFSHPNLFGAALLTLCLAAAPFLRHKNPLWLMVPCLAGAAAASFVADSRTSALCMALIAVAWPVYRWISGRAWRRKIILALVVLLVCMLAVSVWYMLFYDPARGIDFALDSALSGRLRLAHTYYLDHAPGLFGYNYADGTIYLADGKEYTFVVDNLYAHILLRYGIIAWLILFAGLFILLFKAYKQNYFGPLLFGLGIFLLYGMAETLGCRVEFNFYIISLWTILYHRPLAQFDGETLSEADGDSAANGELSFREFLWLPFGRIRGRRG